MTLTLELPPEVEGALAGEARRKSTTPESLVLESLRHRYATEASPPVPARETGSPMLALFAQWDAEDATDDPEEIARRRQECSDLMASLAANRLNFEGRTDFSGLLDLDDDAERGRQEKAA